MTEGMGLGSGPVLASHPENDCCCEGAVREGDLLASVVAVGYPAAPLQPPEHDLDLCNPTWYVCIREKAVSAIVSALVELDGCSAQLSTRDAGLFPFILQGFSEPTGIIVPICQQPFHIWQGAQQGRGTYVDADLT